MALEAGSKLGHYEILSSLGAGGMATHTCHAAVNDSLQVLARTGDETTGVRSPSFGAIGTWRGLNTHADEQHGCAEQARNVPAMDHCSYLL